ncbi:MAG: hypothetical protein JXR67_04765 [Bacteroidales bacterium]|nr:hypothetical protein [Bacteroidales bacterium]
MKRLFLGLLMLLPAIAFISSQAPHDPLVSKCLQSIGPNAKYLKDFRIQLGESSAGETFRYKASMFLWKDTKYRFTLCTSDNSKGQLILTVKDKDNNNIASSVDFNSGTVYAYIDLICNRSEVYQIWFDFNQGHSGSGVVIVSMIQ